jgi:thiol:disulfide interchange protein
MKRILLLIVAIATLSAGFARSNSLGQKSPVSYEVKLPAKVKAGKAFDIQVVFETQSPWYIYAPTGVNEANGMIETSIDFKIPEGIKKQGEVEFPAPHPKGTYQVLDGKEIVFKQNFVADKSMKGKKVELVATITYQTCNKDMCLPPQTEEKKIELQIK